MNNVFTIAEKRKYFSNGPYRSIRDGVVFYPYKFKRYSDQKKASAEIGRVWQISKHSWGWMRYDYFGFVTKNRGKATTRDQAIQRVIAAR